MVFQPFHRPLGLDRQGTPKYSVIALMSELFRRPLFLIAILYSIAICYERVIDIEIVKPYRILGFMLIAGVLFRGVVRIDRLVKVFLAYLVVGFLAGLPSLFDAGGREDIFVNTALLWVFNIATYLAMYSAIRSRRDIVILGVVHSFALLTSAYGIAQEAAAAELSGGVRLFGDFKNPANAAISMLFSCLVILTVLLRTKGKNVFIRIMFAITAFVVPAFFIYTSSLTGSRSGTVLVVSGVICYLFMRARRLLVFLAFPAILLAGISVFSPATLDSFSASEFSESNVLAARVEKKGFDTDRLYLWRSGFDAWVDSYGLGLGIARYPEVHKEYFAPYAHKSDSRWMYTDLSLHNDYVIALVEHGAFGLFLFVTFCIRLVKTSLCIRDPYVRAISISVLLGIAINGFTHASLPYFAVWFYFSLMVAWHRAEESAAFEQAVPTSKVCIST